MNRAKPTARQLLDRIYRRQLEIDKVIKEGQVVAAALAVAHETIASQQRTNLMLAATCVRLVREKEILATRIANNQRLADANKFMSQSLPTLTQAVQS